MAQLRTSCDLLEKSYLCGINNNIIDITDMGDKL